MIPKVGHVWDFWSTTEYIVEINGLDLNFIANTIYGIDDEAIDYYIDQPEAFYTDVFTI